jgi:hypothetical protein
MRPGVDFQQLLDTDLGVNLGRLQFLVAEQLLDKADVRAALEHVSGAGVAEQVATALTADVGGFDVFGHLAAQDVRIEGFPVTAQKQRRLVGVEHQQRPHVAEVAFEPDERTRTDRRHAVFAAFALPYLHGVPLLVDREHLQPCQLAAAQRAKKGTFRNVIS